MILPGRLDLREKREYIVCPLHLSWRLSSSFTVCAGRYNTGEIIVMDQVQKYMDGPRLLRMRLSEYIPQLSTRNVDLVP